MKEPIFLFLLIGAMLFTTEHYLTIESETVVVDDQVKGRLGSLWQAQMGSPVTPKQLDSLVDAWIKEEVLFREALRLNLDRDDTIIRRRLVQKLEFLAENIDDQLPTEEDLRSFYSENITQYSEPRRYSFSQIYFSKEAQAKAQKSLLTDQMNGGSMGENSMLNDHYIARSEREIGNILGSEFAGAIESFVLDQWAGPFKSSFGYHFVRLERVNEPVALALVSIEMKVLADYQEDKKQQVLTDYFQSLLEKTQIVHR